MKQRDEKRMRREFEAEREKAAAAALASSAQLMIGGASSDAVPAKRGRIQVLSRDEQRTLAFSFK